MTKNNNKSNNTLMRFGKALAFMLCTTAISSSFATLGISDSIIEKNMQDGMSSVYEKLESSKTNFKTALSKYIPNDTLEIYLTEYQDTLSFCVEELQKLNTELKKTLNKEMLFENEKEEPAQEVKELTEFQDSLLYCLNKIKKINEKQNKKKRPAQEIKEQTEYQSSLSYCLDELQKVNNKLEGTLNKKEEVAQKIKWLTQSKQKWISQLEDSTKMLSLLLRTEKYRLVDEVEDNLEPKAKDRLQKLNNLNELLAERKNSLAPETLNEKIKNAKDSLHDADEAVKNARILTNKVYTVRDTLLSCYAQITELGTDSADCAVLANIGEIGFIASNIEYDKATRDGRETLDNELKMWKLDRELAQLPPQNETIQEISSYYDDIFNSYAHTASKNQFHRFRKMLEAIVKIDRVAGRFIVDKNNVRQRILTEVRELSSCNFNTPEDILDLFCIMNTIQEDTQIFSATNTSVYDIANKWPTILEKALDTIKNLDNIKNQGIVLLQILKETKNPRRNVTSDFYNEVVTSILNFIDNTLNDENSPEILYAFDLWLELNHEINNKKGFPSMEVQRIRKNREVVIDRCINFIYRNHSSYTTYDEIEKIYTVLEKLNTFDHAMLGDNSLTKKHRVKYLYQKAILRYIEKIEDSYVRKEIPELQKIIESLRKINTPGNFDKFTDKESINKIDELRRDIEDYCLRFYKNVIHSRTNDDKTAMYNLFPTLLAIPYSDTSIRVDHIHYDIGEIVK